MTDGSLKKLQFLDALRGWAILFVLLVHSAGPAEVFGFKLHLATFGQRGVQLFYEISAFSLLYSFYARREQSWVDFFLRRFFRIAPLFFLSLGANFVWTVWILKQAPLPPLAYLAGITFLFGFSPSMINAVVPAGWSIAVETTFYALFPIMASRLKNLTSTLVFTLLAMLLCFYVCYCTQPAFIAELPTEYVQFLWFPAEFPIFCLGFVAFFLWRDLLGAVDGGIFPQEPDTDRSRGAKAFISLGFLLVAAGIAVASFPPSNYRLYPSSVCFVFFILALAIHPWRLLVNPAIATVGRLSFSLYLVHPYLMDLLRRVLDWMELKTHAGLFGSYHGLFIAFFVLLAGSLAISWFTYRYVELPGIALGKRLVARRSRNLDGHQGGAVAARQSMETEQNPSLLRSRLRFCYVAWPLSILIVWAIAALYRRHDPETADQTVTQMRAKIAADNHQIEDLSAAVLSNQRALGEAQRQLARTAEDYNRAMETIKQLQASGR